LIMIGHGYAAPSSPVHHQRRFHADDNLAQATLADGTITHIEMDAPPESEECRHERLKDQLALEAEMARAEIEEGGCYNDPTFPTIIKNGQALEFSTYNEALIHMEKMLIDGVDVDSRDRHRMTALHYNYCNVEVVDWLHAKNCDLNARGAKGRTALHLCAADYQMRNNEVMHLLDLGADPNAKDDTGLTPLSICCMMHNKSAISRIGMVRNLLNAHADPGIANMDGNALHHSLWAAIQDSEKDPEKPAILRTLLEGDKDCINIGTPGSMIEHRAESDGNTPLQRLCSMDSNPHASYGVPDPVALRRVCEYLIQNKADYRGPDGEGMPPRRRVRSKVMRDFFNDASKVSVPGSPAKVSD